MPPVKSYAQVLEESWDKDAHQASLFSMRRLKVYMTTLQAVIRESGGKIGAKIAVDEIAEVVNKENSEMDTSYTSGKDSHTKKIWKTLASSAPCGFPYLQLIRDEKNLKRSF